VLSRNAVWRKASFAGCLVNALFISAPRFGCFTHCTSLTERTACQHNSGMAVVRERLQKAIPDKGPADPADRCAYNLPLCSLLQLHHGIGNFSTGRRPSDQYLSALKSSAAAGYPGPVVDLPLSNARSRPATCPGALPSAGVSGLRRPAWAVSSALETAHLSMARQHLAHPSMPDYHHILREVVILHGPAERHQRLDRDPDNRKKQSASTSSIYRCLSNLPTVAATACLRDHVTRCSTPRLNNENHCIVRQASATA